MGNEIRGEKRYLNSHHSYLNSHHSYLLYSWTKSQKSDTINTKGCRKDGRRIHSLTKEGGDSYETYHCIDAFDRYLHDALDGYHCCRKITKHKEKAARSPTDGG